MDNSGLTPKQQVSEALRQAESVLVITSNRPTVDQLCGVLSLAMILRKYGKKVTAVVSDRDSAHPQHLPLHELDRNLSGLRDFIMSVNLGNAEVDKLKYTIEDGKLNVHVTPFKGGFNASDVSFNHGSYQYDVVVTLGVPSVNRLDRVYNSNLHDIPIVNVDFHRSNENYGAINLIETNAASLAEILAATSESLQPGMIDEAIATVMLTGIISSTDRFTASHTTAKSLTLAAQMIAAGAKHQTIVNALYQKGKPTESAKPFNKPAENRPAPANPRPGLETAVTPNQDLRPGLKETEVAVEELLPPTHIEPVDLATDPLPEIKALSEELHEKHLPSPLETQPTETPESIFADELDEQFEGTDRFEARLSQN